MLVNFTSNGNQAKPFLKWAGGKSQLLPQFQEFYPAVLKMGKVDRYIEPFVGGGAVFFDVSKKFRLETFYLFDINEELVLTYRVIQKEPNRLIQYLQEMANSYLALSEEKRKTFYYSVRDDFNSSQPQFDYQFYSDDWVVRASQLMFMNRTCFNGLFRLNSHRKQCAILISNMEI